MSRAALASAPRNTAFRIAPLHFSRPASTSTPSPTPLPTSTSASPTAASTHQQLPLTWPHYLSLRRQRRLWSTLTSIPTTLAGSFIGGGYFMGLEADPTQLIMGIEPMYVYGGATMGCMGKLLLTNPTPRAHTSPPNDSFIAHRPTPYSHLPIHLGIPNQTRTRLRTNILQALGYLLGPTLGSTLFSLTHPSLSRGKPAPLEIMDREFYDRIKRKRGDPSFQSVNNPAPDFYGEKITSLPAYRRWLRDQIAYKRKAMHGVPGEAE